MYDGSCLCQKIHYQLTQEPGDFGYCHCVSCRKASGSAHAANAPVMRKNFHLLAGAAELREFESSPGMIRAFCSNCGSPIYAFRTERPELLGIRLGTLDTPFSKQAKEHRYVAEKATWETIEDQLPQYAGPPH
ncbi:GFA family protein [Candidimonas humi]|uniref:GFA family protein n=1 Tax=Candidimonas humi TaxID=683355 RepID=A0ABV8P4S7_9BURK|nr:GFA family protein [Candidimonas humi]